VCHVAHSKGVLDGLDSSLVLAREYFVNVSNHGSDVGGTVVWHLLADWFKVTPVISEGKLAESE